MAFQPSAPHKKRRWLAVLAIVMLIMSLSATSALAANPTPANFTFTVDDHGQNDEPGQKDLTAQSSVNFDGSFYTAWKWDDIAWNGGNTGDGCSLFDTGTQNGFVNYAVCGTVQGKNPVTLVSVVLYTCSDKRADRCTNPVLALSATSTAGTYCTVYDKQTGSFPVSNPDNDTLIVCNISLLAAAATPPITVLTGGTLLNTCSYPSQEPNSDPSDCVLTAPPAVTSVSTTPTGVVTWSITLNDKATMSPTTAAGSVVFKLWGTNTSGTCGSLVWTSPSVAVNSSGEATTNGGGTPNNGNTITNLNYADSDGVYYWTAAFTPTNSGDYASSGASCGEGVTITPAAFSVNP